MTRWMLVFLSLFILLYFPVLSVEAASELEDGKYTIDYEMVQGDSDSVSISNDYWLKPATLIIKDGKITVQHVLKNSTWVVGYQVENNGSLSESKVISTDTDADKRTVQFGVSTIDKPTIMKIHVIVESINYNHKYTVRMSYKADTLKLVEADKKEEEVVAAVPTSTPKPTGNPSVNETDDATKPSATTTPASETKQPVQQNAADQAAEIAPATKEPLKSAEAATVEEKEKEKAAPVELEANGATTIVNPTEAIGAEQDNAETADLEINKENSDYTVVADTDAVAQDDEDSIVVDDQDSEKVVAEELEIKELEKKSKTWLWVTLIVIVIASFAGGAVRYYKAKRK